MSDDSLDAEPLDGKVAIIRDYKAALEEHGTPVVHRDDVAAAVRWYEREIKHTGNDWFSVEKETINRCKHCAMARPDATEVCPDKVKRKLGEAFADVVDK